MTHLSKFATVDPFNGMNPDKPGKCQNLVSGQWRDEAKHFDNIPDPMNGENFIQIPNTENIDDFIKNLASCPKSGLHNPLKNVERYVMLGNVCAKAAEVMRDKEVEDFFVRLIQRVMPKTDNQCFGEVKVTRTFLENFAGDGVRFLGRGFSNPGDYIGQESSGYRWPYGPVVIVAPFNFPLEIPGLQFLGAVFMGNRPLIKSATTVGVVFEQFLRLLIYSGLPATDADMIHCSGSTMGNLIKSSSNKIRMLQFTGSSEVAEQLSQDMNGRIRVEDAGFDWKVIGPDYSPEWEDYVAWQCDEDAYNASGQKCSAQSILFVHVLFGNEELESHKIPSVYGSLKPTAIEVPVEQLMTEHFDLITSEVFGPVQVIVNYKHDQLPIILETLEKIPLHLTAAVVSNDPLFQQKVLGLTVNGTTYAGIRARTTGAPQNHWFGPSGDPRSAGIGTPEAIISTWSGHREIIKDIGPIDTDWSIPELS